MDLGGAEESIVRFYEGFLLEGRQCLVFELLDKSLYDVLKLRSFRGLHLSQIQGVAFRTLESLRFLARPELDVIHADIKPENLLLPMNQDPAGVKVIDLGSACRTWENMQTYVQSRFYRAPEVLLGLPYAQPIDIWSLACTLCELYTGRPLFSGKNEVDQIINIMEVVGMPPTKLVSQALQRQQLRLTGEMPQMPAKAVGLFKSAPDGYKLTRHLRFRQFPTANPLEHILGVNSAPEESSRVSASRKQLALFADLLIKMLRFDQADRFDANTALQHAFFQIKF